MDGTSRDGCPGFVTMPAVRTAAPEVIACATEDSASNPGPLCIGHLRSSGRISSPRRVLQTGSAATRSGDPPDGRYGSPPVAGGPESRVG